MHVRLSLAWEYVLLSFSPGQAFQDFFDGKCAKTAWTAE